jgi:glycine cleavage system regulatory protein
MGNCVVGTPAARWAGNAPPPTAPGPFARDITGDLWERTEMNTRYVIALVGDDRPGLVEKLASVVAGHDGSWSESRMSVLAGQFAGVVLVRVDSEKAEALERDLKELAGDRLQLSLRRADATPKAVRPHHAVCLELTGHDRPGLVHEITRVLNERDVNIDDLVTERMSGAMSGGALFRAVAELQVPDDLPLEQLRDDIEALANELMVDIHVRQLVDE